jgi:drug/metabolite transporter superfamily protein YnfA
MWPLAGGVMVLGGLMPSLLHWLSAQEAPGRAGVGAVELWHTALTFAALDATFVAAALLFLWLAVHYCSNRWDLRSSSGCMCVCGQRGTIGARRQAGEG